MGMDEKQRDIEIEYAETEPDDGEHDSDETPDTNTERDPNQASD